MRHPSASKAHHARHRSAVVAACQCVQDVPRFGLFFVARRAQGFGSDGEREAERHFAARAPETPVHAPLVQEDPAEPPAERDVGRILRRRGERAPVSQGTGEGFLPDVFGVLVRGSEPSNEAEGPRPQGDDGREKPCVERPRGRCFEVGGRRRGAPSCCPAGRFLAAPGRTGPCDIGRTPRDRGFGSGAVGRCKRLAAPSFFRLREAACAPRGAPSARPSALSGSSPGRSPAARSSGSSAGRRPLRAIRRTARGRLRSRARDARSRARRASGRRGDARESTTRAVMRRLRDPRDLGRNARPDATRARGEQPETTARRPPPRAAHARPRSPPLGVVQNEAPFARRAEP